MAYQIKEVELSEAYGKSAEYEYALVYLLSGVILCKTEKLKPFPMEECTEVRFFSADCELHIFGTEDGMCAVEISDDGTEDIVVKKYNLTSRFSAVGDKLVVQEYLEYDIDGQAVVALTRLKGIE